MRILADDDRGGGGGAGVALAPISLQETWREKKEFPDTRGITDLGDLGDRFLVVLIDVAKEPSEASFAAAELDESKGEESTRSPRIRAISSESGVKKQLEP